MNLYLNTRTGVSHLSLKVLQGGRGLLRFQVLSSQLSAIGQELVHHPLSVATPQVSVPVQPSFQMLRLLSHLQ